MPTFFDTVRDLERLRQIVAVLVRHGFGELVLRSGLGTLVPGKLGSSEKSRANTGKRIRLVLEELGGSFVKLGQIISTRPDLIPQEIIEELKRLQDEVSPLPFEELRAELEEQLGAPISEVFRDFDVTPMASASIGQVHRAKLNTKEGLVDVVVKIQRPRIKNLIERDMDLLYWLAHTVERSIPEANIYCPVALVSEFDRAVSAELDFALEADNAERFSRNFVDWDTVVFPRVYREASSRTVITLSYLRGRKVSEAVHGGASGEFIAREAIRIIVSMIFEHGFFHADPHPGNILILGEPEKPVLGLIDLGLIGRLSPELRDRLIDLMIAISREDSRAIVDVIYAIGTPSRKINRRALESDVSRLSDKYLGKKIGDIEFSCLIRDLASSCVQYGLELPPDFLMVGKALMTVEGIARQIYPDLDLLAEVEPYFLELLARRYSPEKISNDLFYLATRLGTAAKTLPVQAQEILDEMRQGRLSLEIREPTLTRTADRLGKRVFTAIVLGSFVLSAALLISRDHDYAGIAMLGAALVWFLIHTISLAVVGTKTDR
ncbi:MAG: AarF/ABC1/UbiB kinase family protein [Deltaproteobacteria bacterium]|nr:AarF/ABC1/UbiB kinase family protein [Deltaproteobacteria bacterium]